MNTERIEFVNRRGEELSGYLDIPPEEEILGYGVLAHCFTCGKDLKPFANLGRGMTGWGMALLRFDFSGLGESDGDFSRSTLASNVDDLADAAGFLAANFEPPKLLIGHSLGGVAVLQAAKHIGSVSAVAIIGTPADPRHLGSKLSGARKDAMEKGKASVSIGGKDFSLRKEFFEHLAATEMDEVIRGLGKALLVLHSPADEMVEIENAGAIFRAARHPKSFVSLGAADHLLLKEEDSLYAGSVIAAWARYYL